MPAWFYVCIAVPFAVAGLFALFFLASHLYYRNKFLGQVVRIFEEKPLFIIPRGTPDPTAEDVTVRTEDGFNLTGCYLRHRAARRRGVILFGLEFGSNRWAAVPYSEKLRDAGYDVFAYEPRNQGDSDTDPAYQPLQWVTDKDVLDGRAALNYLKARPDTDPRGVGIFGISKGGSVGLMLTAEDRAVRCVVTDGAFATYTTVVPYMRRWVSIYSQHKRLQGVVPDFFYGSIGLVAMNRVAARRGVRFPWVESAVRKIRVPLLMIHGEADTYIKPSMAQVLFAKCKSKVKDLWIVPTAKHNQAPQVEPELYPAKLVSFFDRNLGGPSDGDTDVDTTPTPVALTHREPAPRRDSPAPPRTDSLTNPNQGSFAFGMLGRLRFRRPDVSRSYRPEPPDDDEDEDDDLPDDVYYNNKPPTVPCPYCRELLPEDAQYCSRCEKYISAEDAPPARKPTWIVIGLLVCLVLAIMMAFL